jgi:hypothetical protein
MAEGERSGEGGSSVSLTDVLAEALMTAPNAEVPRWYTRDELALRWRIAPKTISNWLSTARAQGFGPSTKQYRRQQDPKHGGCIALIRADYAVELFERMKKL